MHVRRSSAALAVLGILLIAGALVVRFALAPSLQKLPSGLDKTSVATGTISIPDPAKPGAMIEQPIEMDRHLTARNSDSDTSVAQVVTTIYALPRTAGHPPLSTSTVKYALDRTDYGQAAAPGGVQVVDQKHASTISLAPNPSTEGQSLFDPTLRQALPLTYVSTSNVDGREQMAFTAAGTGPIADPDTAAALKAALGKKFGTDGSSAPTAALAAMGVPESKLAGLGTTVPVNLVSDSSIKILADQKFGSIVSVDQKAQFGAALGDPSNPLMVLPLQVVATKNTNADVASSISSLSSGQTKLSLIETWIPLALAIIGLILLIVAWMRRRPGAAGDDVAATPSPVEKATASS